MRTLSLSLLLPLLGSACTGSDGESGVSDTCRDSDGRTYTPCRAFRGRLRLPPATELNLDAKPFQVAAVGFAPSDGPLSGDAGTGEAGAPAADGATAGGATTSVAPRLFFGPTFAHQAGAGQRPTLPFSVVVPCEMSVNLLLQVPTTDGGSAPGQLVAAMRFLPGEALELTTLVDQQQADLCGAKSNIIDLGIVELELAQPEILTSGVITLGEGNSVNPLALIDTDGDGTMNLADPDDDNDGTPDSNDSDAAGDGISDEAQLLSALPDDDQNATPDLFEAK
jgi:hypothetical protein